MFTTLKRGDEEPESSVTQNVPNSQKEHMAEEEVIQNAENTLLNTKFELGRADTCLSLMDNARRAGASRGTVPAGSYLGVDRRSHNN